jgi:hypothetical protein
MIQLIIIIMIVVAVVVLVVREDEPCMLIYMLFATFPAIFWGPMEEYKIETDTGYKDVPIVSLRGYDKSTISGGGMFLGWSVSGGSREQYVVMEKRDGLMRRKYIDCAKAYVQESDDQPCVRYKTFDRTYSIWFHGPWRWGKVRSFIDTAPSIIVIPTGSLIHNFEGV